MKFVQTVRSDPSWAAFQAFAFLAGFSMPAARAALAACLVLTLCDRARRRTMRFTAPAAGWLVYLALAAVVTAAMAAANWDPLIQPGRGLPKLAKLLWFAAIPLGVVQVDSRARLLSVLRAFVRGCAVTALCLVLLHPLLAWFQVSFPSSYQMVARELDPAASTVAAFPAFLYRAVDALGLLGPVTRWIELPWRAQNYAQAIVKLGSMQDAQRLMVALPAALCLAAESLRDRSRPRRAAPFLVLALVALALPLAFKRGPVIAGFSVSFLLLLSRLRWWKAALVLLALALAAAAMPHVRGRFAELPSEFRLAKGGRALMWTRLVPELHRDHPWGVGFRALTSAKMLQAERRAALDGEEAALEERLAGLRAREAAGEDVRPWIVAVDFRLWRMRHWRAADARATELARARPAPGSPEAAELELVRRQLESWEKLGVTDRYLELDRNHVHSSPLQAFVDFGWAGLAAWALWMALGFRATWALARRSRRPAADSASPETLCFAAPLAMFGALVLFGLVEYNLADAAVVLLYGLALGLTGPSLLRSE
ncbi:MAG: hypothetical protein IJV65_01540 [Kiritimatiellae bacterium]|nr:hypothetical protein [Kiritimatiellia bacterium]